MVESNREGYITVPGGQVWYKVVGSGESIPLLTLVTCGRYDLLGPPCAETLRQGIPNCEMRVFENSAHMAHLEETESYLQVVDEFVRSVG